MTTGHMDFGSCDHRSWDNVIIGHLAMGSSDYRPYEHGVLPT